VFAALYALSDPSAIKRALGTFETVAGPLETILRESSTPEPLPTIREERRLDLNGADSILAAQRKRMSSKNLAAFSREMAVMDARIEEELNQAIGEEEIELLSLRLGQIEDGARLVQIGEMAVVNAAEERYEKERALLEETIKPLRDEPFNPEAVDLEEPFEENEIDRLVSLEDEVVVGRLSSAAALKAAQDLEDAAEEEYASEVLAGCKVVRSALLGLRELPCREEWKKLRYGQFGNLTIQTTVDEPQSRMDRAARRIGDKSAPLFLGGKLAAPPSTAKQRIPKRTPKRLNQGAVPLTPQDYSGGAHAVKDGHTPGPSPHYFARTPSKKIQSPMLSPVTPALRSPHTTPTVETPRKKNRLWNV
jgi:hypothetical protein